MRFLIMTLSLGLFGCASMNRMALRKLSPLLSDSSDQVTTERNWELFRDASPGNLKFLEVLYLQDPSNTILLGTLVKGYAGYSYAVAETLYFGDQISGVDESIYKSNAISYYTKALDYGMSYMKKKGFSSQEILTLEEDSFLKTLNKRMDDEDLVAVLYMAQSWASLINLQKDNIALVSLVPRVKILFDWVCKKQPDIENGICDIFYAQYEASRPRMLGGNPVLAKKLYAEAIKKHPKHLMIRLGYIEYLILPGFDGEAYEKEAQVLRAEFAKWEDLNRDTLEDKSEYKAVEHLNLYNAIAKKRFEFIEKNKKKIFEG